MRPALRTGLSGGSYSEVLIRRPHEKFWWEVFEKSSPKASRTAHTKSSWPLTAGARNRTEDPEVRIVSRDTIEEYWIFYPKLRGARSRLYRRRFLQERKILVGKLSPRSTQCTPLHRSRISIFRQKLLNIFLIFSTKFCNFVKISRKV